MASGFEQLLRGGLYQEPLRNGVTASIRRVSERVHFQMSEYIASAAANGTVGMTGGVRAFAEGYERNMADKGQIARIHQDIAAHMVKAVGEAYSRTVKTPSGRYRQNDDRTTKGGFKFRYSGALQSALKASSLAQGDAEGIYFVDEGRLTKVAAHWARLNFGAQGTAVAGRTQTRFRILFDGRVVATLGFRAKSSAPFILPPGRWFTKEGRRIGAGEGTGDRFYPSLSFEKNQTVLGGRRLKKTGLRPVKFTRGIKPNEFLDAGLRVMSKELPIRYQAMLDAWFADSSKSAKLPARIVSAGYKPLGLKYRR